MRTLRDLRADSVVVTDRTPDGATLLVVPLLGTILAVVLAEAPVGWARWASAFSLLLVLALLFRAAVPRARTFPLRSGAMLVLDPSDEGDDSSYRVFLEQEGRKIRLLEHRELDVVLGDVYRMLNVAALPVKTAWGIPAEHFTRPLVQAAAMLQPGTVVGRLSPIQDNAARASFGAGVFVLVVVAWTAYHARTVSWLSLVLPAASVAIVFTIGVWIAWQRIHVAIAGDGIRIDRVGLWRRIRLLDLPGEEIVAAHAVGHPPRPLRHLLFETRQGGRAIPFAEEAARQVILHVQPARIEPASTGGASAPAPGSRDPGSRRPYAVRTPRSASHSRKHPC